MRKYNLRDNDPDKLHAMVDEIAERGGCQPGVDWGHKYAHVGSFATFMGMLLHDDEFDPLWASWCRTELDDILDAGMLKILVKKTAKKPKLAARIYVEYAYLLKKDESKVLWKSFKDVLPQVVSNLETGKTKRRTQKGNKS